MLHADLNVAKAVLLESFFELAIAFHVCLGERILNERDQWMVLAELQVVLDQLLGCRLHFDSLNLILVRILRVLIVQALSVTVDANLEDILRDLHRGDIFCRAVFYSLGITSALAAESSSTSALGGWVRRRARAIRIGYAYCLLDKLE